MGGGSGDPNGKTAGDADGKAEKASLNLSDLEKQLATIHEQLLKSAGREEADRMLAKLLNKQPGSPLAVKVPTLAERRSSGALQGGAGSPKVSEAGSPRARWQAAIDLAQTSFVDPWASRNIHQLPMEHAVRHRYNPDTAKWFTDDIIVKVEKKPFAAGAMRECFAAKKLSTMSGSVVPDWKKAQNCVAKAYKKESFKRSWYFTDTLVQMDAKMLGELYNRTNPPKKVDFVQPSILEFKDREGAPLYSIEQLIEGDYIKYNSNSGFVLGDDLLRHTPQAFSHFTFDVSGGQKIVVDVQGVGDLYTDPQIHTLDGSGYGEGNLGLRGLANFFRTHECNALCARLGLHPFDRCALDIKSQGYSSDSTSKRGAVGTVSRSFVRSSNQKRSLAKLKESNDKADVKRTPEQLLESLKDVPPESAEALVHLEVAKMYSETVLLPELKPEEDPADACKAGVFHLQRAAALGCELAQCILARVHCEVEPSQTQIAALTKAAVQAGELRPFPELALRYAELAGLRGVAAAASAVAHAYATGQGLAEKVLNGKPKPAEAVEWYDRALSAMAISEAIIANAEATAAAAHDAAAAASAAAVDGLHDVDEGDEEEEEEEDGDEKMEVGSTASSSAAGSMQRATSGALNGKRSGSGALSAGSSEAVAGPLATGDADEAEQETERRMSAELKLRKAGELMHSHSQDNQLSPRNSATKSALADVADKVAAADTATKATIAAAAAKVTAEARDGTSSNGKDTATGKKEEGSKVEEQKEETPLEAIMAATNAAGSGLADETPSLPVDGAEATPNGDSAKANDSSAGGEQAGTTGSKEDEQAEAEDHEEVPPAVPGLFRNVVFHAEYVKAVEEEGSVLPGAMEHRYEVAAALAQLLLDGAEGVPVNPTRAAELFNEAAEAASTAMKGKLAQKYFELAAQAEGAAEE